MLELVRDAQEATDGTPSAGAARPTLGFLADYLEEGWPSMDLCAEMLKRELAAMGEWSIADFRPPFRRRFRRLPYFGKTGIATNADRFLNRFWDYPRRLPACSHTWDAVHVVDHSYGQLLHALPSERTGIYCHDLDAFRCLLEPAADRRPRWFRAMARRILSGFQKAGLVFFSTRSVRRQIERHGLVDPLRLVHAPLGHAPEFDAMRSEPELLPAEVRGRRYLLHVGSCIQRKRIDVLIETFARLAAKRPDLLLVKVGGMWTPAQREAIRCGGLEGRIRHYCDIDRRTLAEFYRGALLVLAPSEAEGFGLPVIEALACGTPVLASDLEVFREVGAEAIEYAAVGDVECWEERAEGMLEARWRSPSRDERVSRARRFSWSAHAQAISQAYRRLIG